MSNCIQINNIFLSNSWVFLGFFCPYLKIGFNGEDEKPGGFNMRYNTYYSWWCYGKSFMPPNWKGQTFEKYLLHDKYAAYKITEKFYDPNWPFMVNNGYEENSRSVNSSAKNELFTSVNVFPILNMYVVV